MIFIMFDVESVGLHGEGFAVGWVVAQNGVEVECGYAACPHEAASGDEEGRSWIVEHVVPHLPKPVLLAPRQVRDAFWAAWMRWKGADALLVSDCGWPVEARFLAACIDDDFSARRWKGPYPLHDLASVLLAKGKDPLKTYDRKPSEEPAHHPTMDARQSARLLVEALEG